MEPIERNSEERQKALEPLIEEVKRSNEWLERIDQKLSHLEDWTGQLESVVRQILRRID
jgi:predicted  nucleic acid-binding Zn-ribbon protein